MHLRKFPSRLQVQSNQENISLTLFGDIFNVIYWTRVHTKMTLAEFYSRYFRQKKLLRIFPMNFCRYFVRVLNHQQLDDEYFMYAFLPTRSWVFFSLVRQRKGFFGESPVAEQHNNNLQKWLLLAVVVSFPRRTFCGGGKLHNRIIDLYFRLSFLFPATHISVAQPVYALPIRRPSNRARQS